MFEAFIVPQDLRPTDPRFGVGPSLIPIDHLHKLAETGATLMGTSHRQQAVKQVVKEIQEGLAQYFQLPSGYEVVLGNGGATVFWDMMGLGLVEKASLHFTCGEFTEKCAKAHALIPWIKTKEIKVPYGEGIVPHEEAGFDVVCAALNETSTGVQLPAVPKFAAPDVLQCIDATSGAGQIAANFQHIDVFYFSPQKVFASDGGLWVCVMSPKAIERAQRIGKDLSRYIPESLKLTHAIDNGRGHQTYNTPAIATLFLLNEEVKLLNRLGFKAVEAEAKRKAALVYGWAEAKPYLSPFVSQPQYRSSAVATIDIDARYKADDLTKMLRAQGVAWDIDGYRKLGRNQLRISLFHNIKYEDLEKLTRAISLAIESV